MHVSIKDLGVVRLKRLRSLCNENQIADFHEMNVEIIDFLRNGAVGVVNVEEKEKAVSNMLFVHNAILREQISVQNNISNLKSQIDRLRSRISGHSSDINYITIPEQGTSFNISNVEGNQESDNSWKDDILLSDLEIVVDMNMNWLYVDCTATNNSKSELHSISLQLFFTDSTQSQQSVQNFNSTTFPLRPSDSTTLTSKILIPPNFLISNNHQSTPLLKMTVFWKRKPTAVDINANESIKDDELRAENDTIPTFFHKDVESIAISPEFLNSKRCEHYKFGLDMVLLAKDNLSSSAAVNSLCEYCRIHQYTKCEDGWFTKKTQTTRIDIGLNFHTTNGQPMNRVNATAAPIAILTIYSTSQTAHETILHINQLQNSLPDSIFLKLLPKSSQGLFMRFNRFQDGVLVVDGVKDGGKRVKKVKVVDEFLDLESVEKLEGIVGRLRGNPMLELLMETQESLFG
ncbi:hypothetical protein HK098_001802 [Nowakowskiella sp. JEL0407]|nr:hypothetical protein HK098_001802 [Nowakowskiella sp. JEL0407]